MLASPAPRTFCMGFKHFVCVLSIIFSYVIHLSEFKENYLQCIDRKIIITIYYNNEIERW